MNKADLGVGGDVPEPDGGEAGAGEVEGGDVGLAVRDTPRVVVPVLARQHRHPTSEIASYQWGDRNWLEKENSLAEYQ